MIKYLEKLIDSGNPANSKIFMGLIFGAVTIIIVGLKVVIHSIPMDVLYFLGGMTTAFFGLSSIEKFVPKNTIDNYNSKYNNDIDNLKH
jgi:hypothetical protein